MKGKGWHGESRRHSEVARKGARSKRTKMREYDVELGGIKDYLNIPQKYIVKAKSKKEAQKQVIKILNKKGFKIGKDYFIYNIR